MASRSGSVRPYTRTEQVQTTITRAEREQLDAYAASQTCSRADAIRRLVLAGLKITTTEVDDYHRQMQELRRLRKENQR